MFTEMFVNAIDIYIHTYYGWHGTQMSRFGTYLGSGSRFDTISVQHEKKEIYYARFIFIYFEQTVVQIKNKSI